MKEGWENKKLSEICGFVRGPFGGSLKKNIFKIDGYAVYEQQHAIYDQFEDIRYFIDETKFNEMNRFVLNSGDLIMSCSGTMGKIAIVPANIKEGIINQALLKLTPSKKVDTVYLKLWLESESFQESIKKHSGGAAIQNVASVAILKQIEIQLPPLPEQQRIVSIIDEAFEAIDKAIENTQKNLQNAKELFESYLNNVFGNVGEGWVEKRFEEIIQVNQIGIIRSTKEQGSDKPYRYLKMDSMSSDNILIHDRYVYVDADKSELDKFTLNDGDFLFNTRNSFDLVGKTCVFKPIDDKPTLYNNNIMRVVFRQDISSSFINYAFSSMLLRERLQKLKSGTTSVVGIYYKGLRNLKIPLTSYNEQQKIVCQVEALKDETKKLETLYQQKLRDLEELKKSVLNKAFAGEL